MTFASGLLYDFDSDVVRADAAQNLRTLAACLAEYPNTDLLIVGHTDAVGTSAYNQTLAQRRATAAFNDLVAQGQLGTASSSGSTSGQTGGGRREEGFHREHRRSYRRQQ